MEDREQVRVEVDEPAVAVEGSGQREGPEAEVDGSGSELDGVRDLIVKAYPEIVPELLAGESVDELLASVPAAREAYTRIAATVQEQTPSPVPTGSGRRPAFDPEGLSPEAKIRAGLGQHSL